MRTLGVVGAALLTLATAGATGGSAWAQSPQVPDSSQVTTAPGLPGVSQNGLPQSRPLFTIGKLEVHIWAPMEPYYDANMNRTAAENPIWDGAE